MDRPFANQFQDMLIDLTPQGGMGREYSELTQDQRAIVDDMLGGGEQRDLYDALVMQARAINQLNKVVGGISSDDISIDFNPQTGASRLKVRPKRTEESGGADLGTAEKEYMVYQRKANDETTDNPVYGWDYLRSVAATEE